MSTPIIDSLVVDLSEEQQALHRMLDGEPASTWTLPTPAEGWTVHDQIAHLARFDEVTRMCVAEPAAFISFRDGLEDLQIYVDSVGPENSHRTGSEMLQWWEQENSLLQTAALKADPTVRVPWFGPSMSLASKLTARIMETWAHGQDVADAMLVDREPTARLRHIARIGMLAFPNSFRARALDVPEASVHVSLKDPTGGEAWVWGPPGAVNSVTGPAEDFCLVVTQRRNVADTRLDVTGEVATRWMDVAQAFAGPAGEGRTPGQFPVPSDEA